MTDLVKAYWNCSYPVEIAGQGTIGHGDPAMIPKAEAEASENWRLSAPAAKPKRTRKPRKPRVAKPEVKIDPPPAPDGNAALAADTPTTREESS